MIPTYAVIPTANRPEVCFDAVDSIWDQVDGVVVIDSGFDKPVPSAPTTYSLLQWSRSDPFNPFQAPAPTTYSLLQWSRSDPFNLSQAWNMGITMAKTMAGNWYYPHESSWYYPHESSYQWNVAVINDDTIVPPGWVETISTRMRYHGAAAACSGSPTGKELMHVHPRPVDLRTRLSGWAFMLAGEKAIMADERLVWWFGDDDLDWRCRLAGGTLVIPGLPVENRFPNGQHTPERQEQAGRDRATFESIWGMAPW